MEDYELDPDDVGVGDEVIIGGYRGEVLSKAVTHSQDRYEFEIETEAGVRELVYKDSESMLEKKNSFNGLYSPSMIHENLDEGASDAENLARVVDQELGSEEGRKPVEAAD